MTGIRIDPDGANAQAWTEQDFYADAFEFMKYNVVVVDLVPKLQDPQNPQEKVKIRVKLKHVENATLVYDTPISAHGKVWQLVRSNEQGAAPGAPAHNPAPANNTTEEADDRGHQMLRPPLRGIRVPKMHKYNALKGLDIYWCPYQPNDTLGTYLGTNRRYMFTATMTGCHLGVGSQANGQGVAVVHSNYIRNTETQSATTQGDAQVAAIQQQFPNNAQMIGPDDYRDPPSDAQVRQIRIRDKTTGWGEFLAPKLLGRAPTRPVEFAEINMGLKVTAFGLLSTNGQRWEFYTHRYHVNSRTYTHKGLYHHFGGIV